MNMDFKRKLTIPYDLKQEYPVTADMAQVFEQRDRELKDILGSRDSRLALIIGPCSADREDSVLDYVTRLVPIQEKVKDKLLIIPRVYTNKPRTTGAGYKGMLHQPDTNAAPDMLKGLIAIRELHMRVLRETGFSCADEMLYPENYKYLDDVLAYVAVGARSVEDQQHRLTSSGISVRRRPVRHDEFYQRRPAQPYLHLPGLGGHLRREPLCPRHSPGLYQQAR